MQDNGAMSGMGEEGDRERDEIARVREGTWDVRAAYLEPFREPLKRVAVRDIGAGIDGATTSDLVAEAIVTASLKLPQYRGENRAMLWRWLRVILARRIKSQARRPRLKTVEMPQPHLEPEGREPTGSAIESAKEQVELHRKARSMLKAIDQRILFLRDCEGLTFVEIGEQLGGMTPAAVKARYDRADRKIVALLRREGD